MELVRLMFLYVQLVWEAMEDIADEVEEGVQLT